MKKRYKAIFVIMFFMLGFIPFHRVEAASTYTVEMVSNQTGNKVVGSYNSYSVALNAMNAQNSTSSSVATIYRDGVPVDSKYAIFKFKPGSTYALYSSATTGSSFTSVHGSYGTDAALLGYSDNGRVKIMISGYVGWTNISNGVVTPISLMGVSGNSIYVPGKGNKIRTEPSTSAKEIGKVSTPTTFVYTETRENGGYTWFKITYNGQTAWIAKGDSMTVISSGDVELGTYYKNYGPTGNLIHHFTYYNGSGYGDNFSNLGTAPSYLTPDVKYYSFDGNYFYSSLIDMLDDYRSFWYEGSVSVGSYNKSVNKDNPFYAYYMYLTSHSVTGYTAEDFDSIISNKGYNASTSKMYGTGKYFKEAEALYGQNALMMFGTAMNESATGTSQIAMDKNNLFGYGAADSCAYDCAYSYNTVRDSILDYAKKTGTSYSLVTGKFYYGSHYGNKASGRNIMYATDPYWGEKQAGNSFINDGKYGGKDFNSSTIGVAKKGRVWVQVFKRPEQSDSAYLYTMKNPNSYENAYDMSVNIIDKVSGNGQDFYKIYTDLPGTDNNVYGYVRVSDFNVSNNQPVITASDKTINEGDEFNPLEGVSASDVENGNLTSRITYESDVKPEKEGTYHVTYTVVDNSNFHASKTITVKVISAELPIITAEDKEVKQFEEFDYMDGVSAKAYDGTDLTDDITYEETVNTDIADTYEVTYKVKDAKGKEASKTINVTVIPNEKPVINASDKEIYLNSDFDPLEGVTASDAEDGPIEKIEYKGEVKTDTVGDYKVTYIVIDKNGQKTEKTITVKVIVNQLPVINAYDKTIYLNSDFDPLDGVTAYDPEDGTITKINVDLNEVKTNELGQYKVTYSVTDSYEQTVTKTITVTVSEKVLEEKEGLFYIDYLSNINGKLELKGYNTIKGIDNDLNQKIEYKITLKNVDNGKTYEQYATRITDDKDIPFDVYSSDGKNYKYSWFTFDFDLSGLPAGNYTASIMSIGEDYYSENVINNKTNSTQITSFNNNKYVSIRNNYNYDDSPIEFIIRDEKLADKTVGSYYNQFDNYIDFNFTNDNKLHLRGMSYSYGMNLSSSTNVTRKIIFENQETYETYIKDLGSVTNGDYSAPLPVSDGLDKTRAWYDNNLDISDIPKGNYTIYITTSANVTDISEFTEKLGRTLDDVKATINGKKYSFNINFSKNSRIEMKVE